MVPSPPDPRRDADGVSQVLDGVAGNGGGQSTAAPERDIRRAEGRTGKGSPAGRPDRREEIEEGFLPRAGAWQVGLLWKQVRSKFENDPMPKISEYTNCCVLIDSWK